MPIAPNGRSGNGAMSAPLLKRIYAGKTVLVTGHTGFKGTWLTAWLLRLGAKVVGLSKDIPTKPSMFEELGLAGKIAHHIADVRDLPAVKRIVAQTQPDFVFHLAAQAIVSVSYADPVETMTTNAIGTMNVLEALREVAKPCAAIMITSDKCYNNVEWVWGYKETDELGGTDIYSGSKGAAELVIRSYVASFFKDLEKGVRIATGRAGNVIGGGDWAQDRIIVDCVRAWNEGKPLEMRSPDATRPWQHVLEPLSGYLTLGAALAANPALHGEAFNFGPRSEQNRTVLELIEEMATRWKPKGEPVRILERKPFHEAGLLKLNCDKALFHLRWEANLDYRECIRFITDWYSLFYKGDADMYALTMDQIRDYEQIAAAHGRVWTRA
jgi:CDP-glucose 4,6-dehydratase